MKQYTRKPTATVIAIQMNLDVEEFHYTKWGGPQTAKPGDWLVKNGDEVYTVNKDSFAVTYTELSPGVFFKSGNVWAVRAVRDGEMPTKEGKSLYSVGDYLVYNNPDGTDGYCMSADKFNSLYTETAS